MRSWHATTLVPDEDLARRFRAARKAADVPLARAAVELGVSVSTLTRMERAEKPIPRPYLLWARIIWSPDASLLSQDDYAF